MLISEANSHDVGRNSHTVGANAPLMELQDVKAKFLFAMSAALVIALPAQAGVVLTSVPGSNPYSGPTPTYDFETAVPASGGSIVTGNAAGSMLSLLAALENIGRSAQAMARPAFTI